MASVPSAVLTLPPFPVCTGASLLPGINEPGISTVWPFLVWVDLIRKMGQKHNYRTMPVLYYMFYCYCLSILYCKTWNKFHIGFITVLLKLEAMVEISVSLTPNQKYAPFTLYYSRLFSIIMNIIKLISGTVLISIILFLHSIVFLINLGCEQFFWYNWYTTIFLFWIQFNF